MKKAILFLFILSLIVAYTSCGDSKSSTSYVIDASNVESDFVSSDSSFIIENETGSKTESSENTELVKKEITEEFIKECNRSSGGYAVFNGTNWFYSSFGEEKGIYKCDADGKNAVCIDEFNNSHKPKLDFVGDTIFYLKTEILDTPIEIGEYEILFNRELRSYSNGKVQVLSSDNIEDFAISGEYIYYTAQDLKLYRMKLDGTEKESIGELSYPMAIQIVDDKIYTHLNEALYERDLNGKILNVYNVYHYDLVINDDEIYYIDASDMSLRYTNDFNETFEVIVESVKSFCVFNNKLVYEKAETGELYTADLDGKNSELIGNGSAPIVVNGCLLYVSDNEIVVAS